MHFGPNIIKTIYDFTLCFSDLKKILCVLQPSL